MLYPIGKPGGKNKENEKETMFEEIKTVCFPKWMKKSTPSIQ